MAQASRRKRHLRRIKRQRTLAWRAAEQLAQQNHGMRTFLIELQRRVADKEAQEKIGQISVKTGSETPTETTADAPKAE